MSTRDAITISSQNQLSQSPQELTPDTEKAASPSNIIPGSDIPDGGLRAWLCVIGAWSVMSATFGYSNSFGVFQSYYITKYPEVSASDISWVGSVLLFFQFNFGAFTGPLYDKGYFYYMMYSGTIF
ncbi:uncharacterized protein I206_104138 [Kwoniella pini CBS 10737]|uniref:Major facilitator superfamily (MFS) profile domain-containing protein n=1 Tax=Kwoniella pini CBS 10737 TaxID=1296096 RepID=A0AAJ8L6B4_9TREE